MQKLSLVLFSLILLAGCRNSNQKQIRSISKRFENADIRGKDTSLWYKETRRVLKRAGIPDIVFSKDTFHVHIWREMSLADIYSTDLKNFQGTLVVFTHKIGERPEYKDEDFHYKKISIDTGTAHDLADIYRSLHIQEIPTARSIKGWGDVSDCEVLSIEKSFPSLYSFKRYWAPDFFQSKLSQARRINYLYKVVSVILQSDQKFDTFLNTLPKGMYHYGGMIGVSSPNKVIIVNNGKIIKG